MGMKARVLALAAVLVLLLSGLAGAASVLLDNGGANFGTGDVWRLSAGVENSGSAVAVDAYLGLVLPDGQTIVFFQLTPGGLATSIGTVDTATWKPLFANITLPHALNTGLVNLLDIPISNSVPAGIYTSAIVLTSAGTLNVIDWKAKSFLVGRFTQPVASYLGTYNGTWNNTTFGSNGPAHITVADTAPGSLTATLTLEGNVLGLPAPAPFTHAITLSPSGAITFDGSSPLGMVTGTANADGTANVTISQVGHGIDTVVLTGAIVPGNIDLVYTVYFTLGGTASGTFKALRP
jgi:hypothetical protein